MHRPAHRKLPDIGIGAPVVDHQAVARPQSRAAGVPQVNAQVLDPVGVEPIFAENIAGRRCVGLQTTRLKQRIGKHDLIFIRSDTAKRLPHFARDGDGVQVVEQGLVQYLYAVARLHEELRLLHRVNLHSPHTPVAQPALDHHHVRPRLRPHPGFLQERAQSAVCTQFIQIGIKYSTANLHILIERPGSRAHAHDVAILQSRRNEAVQYLPESIFHQDERIPLYPFYLYILGRSVVLDPSREADEVPQAFPGQQLVAHRALDRPLERHHCFGYWHVQDVVVLQVKVELHGRVVHKGIDIQLFSRFPPDQLNFAHRTYLAYAPGGSQRVKSSIQSRKRETSLVFGLPKGIDRDGAGLLYRQGKLVGVEAVKVGKTLHHKPACLRQLQALQEYFGHADRLHVAFFIDHQQQVGLGNTKNRDPDPVARSQNIRFRGIRAIQGTIGLQIPRREELVAINFNRYK